LGGQLEDGATAAAQAPTESSVGKSEPITRAGNEFDGKLMAGRLDQLGEGPKTRFAMVSFVGADDRLRDASASSEVGLRQACSPTSFAEHRSSTDLHTVTLSRIVY